MFNKTPRKEEVAKIIGQAKNIVALTGAGISTAAGIPDFRGPEGLYKRKDSDIELVFELEYFDKNPLLFYQFSKAYAEKFINTKPSFTHYFLSHLEKENKIATVITQNIDGLHQKAGSTRVYPLHGDYEKAYCRKCKKEVSGKKILEKIEKQNEIPICEVCGGVVKPDIVFFGENVKYLDKAESCIAKCDLLLVLGSSLQVYPAAILPNFATEYVVVVNKGLFKMNCTSKTFWVNEDLDEYFKEIAEILNYKINI